MTDVLSSQDFPRLFACLAPYCRLILGVSGGADSVCLMHLIAEWRNGLTPAARPDVLVVSIDHQLRATSAAEAADVGLRAAELRLPHRTLVWTGPKPESGLQAEARALRYRLFAEAARGPGRAAVVVAHTQDDQAETLIMRLKRGSGVDGLSGMPRVRSLVPDVDLVRPLLDVSRAVIEATLSARGVSWISDPSNDNPLFERVRLRKARHALDALGLSSERIGLAARRLGRARRALEAITQEVLRRDVDLNDGVYACLPREAFLAAPHEIRVRVFEQLIRGFGEVAAPALLSQVEALADELVSRETFRMSLGGAIVSSGERRIRVYREAGRQSVEPVALVPGQRCLWDGRFWVWAAGSSGPIDGLEISPLGRVPEVSVDATLAAAGLQIPEAAGHWPKRALETLPAIWEGSRLIAVPHFDQYQATNPAFRVMFRGLGPES